MPRKNDLSGLKFDEKKILPEVGGIPDRPLSVQPKRVGRPKKKPEEKRDYKVTLSLTQAEGAKLREKAGLANEATYLYAMLEKAGVFD